MKFADHFLVMGNSLNFIKTFKYKISINKWRSVKLHRTALNTAVFRKIQLEIVWVGLEQNCLDFKVIDK